MDNGRRPMTTTVDEAPSAQEPALLTPRQEKRLRWVRDHSLPARVLILFALGILALSALFPLYFMVQAAFRTLAQWNNSELGFPTTFSLDNLRQVWLGGYVGDY